MTTGEAFEIVSRLRKAKLLLAKLRQYRYTPTLVAMFTNKEWAIVAEAAGVNPPGEETITIVLQALIDGSEIYVRAPRGIE